MRTVFVACLVGCLLSGCIDHHEIAVQAASEALSCEPGNVDAYALDNGQWDVRGCGQRATLQCLTKKETGYTCTTVGN